MVVWSRVWWHVVVWSRVWWHVVVWSRVWWCDPGCAGLVVWSRAGVLNYYTVCEGPDIQFPMWPRSG